MAVAVRISDLLALKATPGGEVGVGMLLHGFVSDSSPIVLVDKEAVDGYAVVFTGQAAQDPARLNACLELLQRLALEKIGRKIRIYEEGRRGTWRIKRN